MNTPNTIPEPRAELLVTADAIDHFARELDDACDGDRLYELVRVIAPHMMRRAAWIRATYGTLLQQQPGSTEGGAL